MSTLLALESLYHEIAFVTNHSFDEGREQLSSIEVEHLVKMATDIVTNIKQQPKEMLK